VNEGTINVCRSIQGRSGKNNGYPFFDGTFKGYPKFRRRWHTFQIIYHNLKELVHQFWDNCMDKKVADKICSKESMTEARKAGRLSVLLTAGTRSGAQVRASVKICHEQSC
jgi:hypothetical protein